MSIITLLLPSAVCLSVHTSHTYIKSNKEDVGGKTKKIYSGTNVMTSNN